MENIFKNRILALIMFLLFIQAAVSILLLRFLSGAAEKVDYTYNYDIPKLTIITRLEFLHEYRFSQLLTLVHAVGIETQKTITEELKTTAEEVVMLLEKLASLPYSPEDEKMISDYLVLREKIVDIRDNDIFPLILSGKNKEAEGLINTRMTPVFESRRHLMEKLDREIAQRNKNAWGYLYHNANRSYLIASLLFLFSIIISVWLLFLYHRTLTLREKTERQVYQIDALKTTMNTVNDIVLNALSGLRLFLYSASTSKRLTEDDLQEYDKVINETVQKLEKLGSVEQYETYEAAKGINVVKVS